MSKYRTYYPTPIYVPSGSGSGGAGPEILKMFGTVVTTITAGFGLTMWLIERPKFRINIEKLNGILIIRRNICSKSNIRSVKLHNISPLEEKGYIIDNQDSKWYSPCNMWVDTATVIHKTEFDINIKQFLALCKEHNVHYEIDYTFDGLFTGSMYKRNKLLYLHECELV